MNSKQKKRFAIAISIIWVVVVLINAIDAGEVCRRFVEGSRGNRSSNTRCWFSMYEFSLTFFKYSVLVWIGWAIWWIKGAAPSKPKSVSEKAIKVSEKKVKSPKLLHIFCTLIFLYVLGNTSGRPQITELVAFIYASITVLLYYFYLKVTFTKKMVWWVRLMVFINVAVVIKIILTHVLPLLVLRSPNYSLPASYGEMMVAGMIQGAFLAILYFAYSSFGYGAKKAKLISAERVLEPQAGGENE